jgi:UDP-glucose 4-epimerase
MIILIGGNGFIGKHVCDLLQQRDRAAMVVSRQDVGATDRRPNTRYFTTDQWQTSESRETCKQAKALVYLATHSVPGTFINEPWNELSQNVEPALRLFSEFCNINPAAKITLISSGGTIYGRTGVELVNEDIPAAPISAYGVGKLMIEEALKFSARVSGQPYNVLRLSNPIGIHQTSVTQGIVPIALRAIRDQRPVNIFGDGSNIRDYVDADDVAEAILTACDDVTHNKHTWNVGSGNAHSVSEILEIIQQVAGQKLDLAFKPARSVDVPRIVLDPSRIKRDLGWAKKRSTYESCKKVWDFLNSQV